MQITSGYYANGTAPLTQAYMQVKLCPEDKEQLDRIEAKLDELTKKKEYVQLRVNK